jgi:hypothetical protein
VRFFPFPFAFLHFVQDLRVRVRMTGGERLRVTCGKGLAMTEKRARDDGREWLPSILTSLNSSWRLI